MPDLNLIAINLTRRCNLACEHCYLDATTLKQGDASELSCDEVKSLLDEVHALNPSAMVVLTGGEPLLRADLEEMISHGSDLGLFIVLGTNGLQLTEKRVIALKKAGLMGAGISLDSTDAAVHDDFRGLNGAWNKTMKGINHCQQLDLSFQIHFTVTKKNLHEIDQIIALSESLGAMVINIFFLICTGRGETESDLTPSQYESALKDIIQAQENYPDMIVRPRCAPHFKRVALQLNPEAGINRISGQESDGCLAGLHYCRIAWDGRVTACPYIETTAGDTRVDSLQHIWEQAPQFNALRAPQLEGKCGACEYRLICGGCRARPVAEGKSIMAADPVCEYSPSELPVIVPLVDMTEGEITWDELAQTRLERIPGFIRKIVKKRAEAYVSEKNESVVHVHHLEELTARRFGGKGPGRPSLEKMKNSIERLNRFDDHKNPNGHQH